MRLEWIDDILAVLDCGSLAQAAEKRMLTQSAFTRRVRSIEDNIGTTLFDRRRKPVVLTEGVQTLEPELRALSARLHKLRQTLKTADTQAGKPLTFMCQHALTSTMSPQVVRAATTDGTHSVRVRSGNQDACLMKLLSKDVDLAIMYALPDQSTLDSKGGDNSGADSSAAFDSVPLGHDLLIPVCAPSLQAASHTDSFPIIAYPADVFLGHVFASSIAPRIAQGVVVLPIAETALTLAMVQLAISEIGIAWLPMSLVAKSLASGDLVRANAALPTQALTIKMVRLHARQTDERQKIWNHLAQSLRVGPDL